MPMAACHEAPCLPSLDDVMRSTCRCHNNIHMHGIVHCLIKRNGLSSNTFCQLFCTHNMTIGYKNRFNPMGTQMFRRKLCHLSRTEDERTASTKTAKRSRCKFYCRVADGYGTVCNARFCAYTFSGCNRSMKKKIEHRTRRASLTGKCIRLLHL